MHSLVDFDSLRESMVEGTILHDPNTWPNNDKFSPNRSLRLRGPSLESLYQLVSYLVLARVPPNLLMRLFVIGPQRNSTFRIPEIYDLTEWCCSPCQAQNSECLRHSVICPPLCLMRKCCCSPCQDQNFEVCCGTTNIVVVNIINKRK
jgi:hypothetical protein